MSDAVVQPDAMVVEFFDATIAAVAMLGLWKH